MELFDKLPREKIGLVFVEILSVFQREPITERRFIRPLNKMRPRAPPPRPSQVRNMSAADVASRIVNPLRTNDAYMRRKNCAE